MIEKKKKKHFIYFNKYILNIFIKKKKINKIYFVFFFFCIKRI